MNVRTEDAEPRTRPLPRRRTREELEAIIANRGPEKLATFEELLGAGEDLWSSDEEFDEFLRHIDESRKEPG